MKTYVQFYQYSTGYIPGSTPPKFDDAYKRPIEVCGSDGVMLVDGRWSSSTTHTRAREYAKQKNFIGYTIGHRLGDYSGKSYADQMIKV